MKSVISVNLIVLSLLYDDDRALFKGRLEKALCRNLLHENSVLNVSLFAKMSLRKAYWQDAIQKKEGVVP